MRFKVLIFSYTFGLMPSWVYHFHISGVILCFQLLYGWFQLSLLFHPRDLNIAIKMSWPQFQSCMACFPNVGHKGYSRELFLLNFLLLTCICIYEKTKNKFPWGHQMTNIGKTKLYKLKRSISCCCCCCRCCYLSHLNSCWQNSKQETMNWY